MSGSGCPLIPVTQSPFVVHWIGWCWPMRLIEVRCTSADNAVFTGMRLRLHLNIANPRCRPIACGNRQGSGPVASQCPCTGPECSRWSGAA
ncbi:MAG: hypothetical protein ACI9W2_002561 [Gammaproteobacteria bacterium]|jgi:hypothetical protein